LYKNKKVSLQIGGSDQWGNITTGIEVIRKIFGDENNACGLTINLLTKADGTKFGKTETGAIFLDANRTSPFTMYQYLYNQTDADVEKLLNFCTLLKKEKINQIITQHKKEPYKRIAQKKLAECVVSDVHGKLEYAKCLKISDALFNGQIETLSNVEIKQALEVAPSINVNASSLNIIDLLIEAKVCVSKSEARHLIESKAISVNDKVIGGFDVLITKEHAINKSFSYIRKGKKNYFLVN
jgi:tyrosyl-tRNA synthetase